MRRCLWAILKKDLVLCDKRGNVVAVYPYGSEEHWRFYRVLEILVEARKKRLEKLISKKQEREEKVSQILDEPDKKIIHKAEKRKLKRYNLSQAANILDVPR